LIDCEEVIELLDAYALGASETADSRAIEDHVADCVRCWEELSKAQRTAALVALSVPIKMAPPGLEAQIMQEAARERQTARTERRPAGSRVRFGWPATAGALGLTAAAALAFASFLQIQMNDLRNDKDELAGRLAVTSDLVADQSEVLTVSTAADESDMEMRPVVSGSDAWGVYHWSKSAGKGFITCFDLPPLAEGEVYQAWFATAEEPVSAGTFSTSEDGGCQYPMQPVGPVDRPMGVGVSREKKDGSDHPTSDWLIWAAFKRE
jgi:hypothetical protein